MKLVIALALFAILAVCESRYASPCNAPCNTDIYGEFPLCMSDGSVVCGWCQAKEVACDSGNKVKKVLGEGQKSRVCGSDWKTKGNCKDSY